MAIITGYRLSIEIVPERSSKRSVNEISINLYIIII